jgi:hypothetical protein
MATRYCGTLKLSIRLQADDSYNVRITELNDDARFAPCNGVRLSPHMQARVASDSAAAYDAIARAAVSFAGNEDDAIYNFVEADCVDAVIRRRNSVA